MNASCNSNPIRILLKHISEHSNGELVRQQIDPAVAAAGARYNDQVVPLQNTLMKHLDKSCLSLYHQIDGLMSTQQWHCENAAFLCGMEYALYLAGMAPKPGEGVANVES